jgi:hypothetical protein
MGFMRQSSNGRTTAFQAVDDQFKSGLSLQFIYLHNLNSAL